MEASFMVAMFISVFCHCTGLFYNPVEAGTESTMFLIILIMYLHKLKSKRGSILPEGQMGAILEVPLLCLAAQVALLVIWLPTFAILQSLVDSACRTVQNWLSDELDWLVKKINPLMLSVALLVMESVAFLEGFEIKDVQKFFGCKDDFVSPSVLSFVAQEEVKVLKREWKKLQRQRSSKGKKK
ncbi:uncharacterized protein LOC6526549 [Drosophila yakuba]|uniref:Uncharacterized protein n=1 Tax=Drosophila yakuba TaxID=7245 RepID=B4NWM9_DROYA|nr:uncharacterized protein LOC6526549 [Drosophila yakuba]EDW87371.1 uncharacterized protein Dyak_GE18106 [Drosophila yakuba]